MATDADPPGDVPSDELPADLPDDLPDDLSGDLEVIGRIADSSNHSVLARLTNRPSEHVIYKPVRGERPLWDFPDGTLAGREVAAYLVSRLGGWDLVPLTVLRDGPLGAGAVQRWIGNPLAPVADDADVTVIPSGTVPDGWIHVLDGLTPTGEPVTVVHRDREDVRSLSVLDAVLNNSDRKGSHCLRDGSGRLWAIDHGLCFHPTPKLRTVLWGWAGRAFTRPDLDRLRRFRSELSRPEARAAFALLLPEDDVVALESRVEHLLEEGRHPLPSPDWPPVPWPPV
ncbi:MAG: SCO1664 family protein [Dermatophilaceae bacterium]